MGNIVITTHWTDGDVLPFIRMGKILRQRGHNVTLITHCFYEKMAREAGIDFAPWDTPEQYERMIYDMGHYNDTVAGADEIHAFREKYESTDVRLKEFEIVRKFCQKEDTILLAKNRSSVAALMASEIYQCPIILFFMNPYEMGSMVNFQSLYSERLKCEANELRERVGLPPIDSWLSWQSSPRLQLALWPQWFSSDISEWPGNIEPIGFPLDRKQGGYKVQGCEAVYQLLRDHPEPIIITGGTSKQIRKDFYIRAIEACGLLGRKTIVVTRYKELLPTKLPSNITWFEHLPLDAILPYTGAVIHHGGIGTTSGAIYAAVPQLALAYHVDRPLNASKVKSLGIGEYLPPSHWEQDTIVEALKRILEPEFKNRCVNFLKEIAPDDALAEISTRVEGCVGNKAYAITYESIVEKRSSESITRRQSMNVSSGRQQLSPALRAFLLNRMRNQEWKESN